MRSAFVLASLATFSLTGCPSLGTLFRDRDGIVFATDVAYDDDGDARHKLDLYFDENVAEDAPVVVFVHGGYWNSQDKELYEWVTGLYGNVGVALAREGFVVANTNYRLFPDVKLDGMLDDISAAVAFMHEKFPDASSTSLMGHSAGAHLASAAALIGDADVDALALVSGVYDIPQAVFVDSEENRDTILEPLFGDTEEEQATASTRELFADGGLPTIFVAGTDDFQAVELDFSHLKKSLEDNDDFEFVEVEGKDHAGTALVIGAEDDVIGPGVAEFLRGR